MHPADVRRLCGDSKLAYEIDECRCKIINLGTRVQLSIKDLVSEIYKYYNYTGDIQYYPERSADVRRLCASSELAKKILKFCVEIPFNEGLKLTLDWYNHQELV